MRRLAVLCVLGCGATGPPPDVRCIEAQAVPYLDTRLDVLVVVDTSPAMIGREETLAANLARIAGGLDVVARDFRVGVISADAVELDFRARLTSIEELPAAAALAPDSPHMPRPLARLGPAVADPLFRPDAPMFIALLMGQDDCSSQDYSLTIDDPLACAREGWTCDGAPFDGTPGTYPSCVARPGSALLDPNLIAFALDDARPTPWIALAVPAPDAPIVVDGSGLVPACGAMTAAVRLLELRSNLGRSLVSTCDDDWSALVPPPIVVDEGVPCLFGQSDPDRERLTCAVTETGRDGVTRDVPACDAAGGPSPCFTIEDGGFACEGGVRLLIHGGDGARATGANVLCDTICDPPTALPPLGEGRPP